MKIFLAASYSSQVNYGTGEVFPEYKIWLESTIDQLETFGHSVFCSLRQDGYKINIADIVAAYMMDTEKIQSCEGFIAILDKKISAGVQTEIGYALALNKKVVFAHDAGLELSWFNKAVLEAGQASEIELPFQTNPFMGY